MYGGRLREGGKFSVAICEVQHLRSTQNGPSFTQLCFKTCDGGLSYGWIHVFFGNIDEFVNKVV
jgi:hypothetical protein